MPEYSASPSSKYTPSTEEGRATRLAALQAVFSQSNPQLSQSDNHEPDEEADLLMVRGSQLKPPVALEDGWGPPTPPSSLPRASTSTSHDIEQLMSPSPSPSRFKGKGKSRADSSDWNSSRGDQVILFEESSIARPSSRASVESNVRQNVDNGPVTSSSSISTLLQSLSSVPSYVEKLERQLNTARGIIKERSERISDLEDENRRLKARLRELEDNIALLP